MTTLAIKDPTELKGYTIDFTPWLDDLGVTIASIDSVTVESGLTRDSQAIDSTSKKVTVVVSGGTAGNSYKITVRINATNAWKLVGTMIVPVENK